MSEQSVCPFCGYPLLIPDSEPAENMSIATLIEAKNQEIKKLRETIAMLRGTRSG